MSRNPQGSEEPSGAGSTHAPAAVLHGARAARGGLWRLLRAPLGRRFAVNALLAAVVLELAVLGIGVVKRLENLYRLELELTSAQFAQEEAKAFSHGFSDSSVPTGSAGIGATETATAPEGAAPDAPVESSNEAPPLKPRDVQTIVAQEAGLWEDGGSEGNAGGTPAAETPAPEVAANATPVVQGKALSDEDAAELDRLIRQGVAAMTAGDMRRCVLSFEQARCINADHPALLYYYGLAYDKLLNPDRARQYYMRVFRQRDRAGRYFERASRRLTYGLEQPGAMRGKLSFGPHQVRHSYDEEEGERVSILLPVMLAPGEEVRPDDIYVTFQAFDLVNGRKIEFARLAKPQMFWENSTPTWSEWEENLCIEYAVPPLTQDELDVYGDLKYYGFTAKLYYKGEPLDCISSPSALILQEQRLLSRRAAAPAHGGLLPDDGRETEEALPAADFLNDVDLPLP